MQSQFASRPKPLRLLLRLFSSIWTGIVLAALLFIYCSIGSAVPEFRQRPFLEMTEFEWFHWWPFNALVVLLCITICTATLRRIPLNVLNAGVWTIHTGIIMLCLGSYVYFGTKVEGDAPVFRRQVKIDVPGGNRTVGLVAIPGAEASAVGGDGVWNFQIESTNSAWPILSDEHKGEKAYAVNVGVRPPDGPPFVRQLLATNGTRRTSSRGRDEP